MQSCDRLQLCIYMTTCMHAWGMGKDCMAWPVNNVAEASIYRILVVCPSARPSVCYRRSAEVIWPCYTTGYISDPWVLEARTGQSPWAPALALATGMNSSFLDGLYKTKQQMGDLHIQWPVVRQAVAFVRSHGLSGGSRFWLWLLAFSSHAKSKLTIIRQLIDLAMCSNKY